MKSIASSDVPTKARPAMVKRRSPRRRFDHGKPIWRPNFSLTVLVWVSLCIMVLATVRPQTHALLIDLPIPSFESLPAGASDRESHVISIRPDDTLLWDGELVDQAALMARAQQTLAEPIAPVIVFDPAADASYETSLEALAILARAGLTRNEFCFGSLAEHRHFGSQLSPSGQLTLITSVVDASLPIEQEICDHFAAGTRP